MKKPHFFIVAIMAVMCTAVYSGKDGKFVPYNEQALKGTTWELHDSLLTDSGKWILNYKVSFNVDSTCHYDGSYWFSSPARVQMNAAPGLNGKWEIGNWRYPDAYNFIYIYNEWDGAIESWKIISIDNDVLKTRSCGIIMEELQGWPGKKDEFKWNKVKH